MYKTDRQTLEEEVEIDYFKSSGPGGQRKNKTETAVRIKHKPSGIKVVAQKERSQARNLELAFERLIEKLEELNRPEIPRIPTKVPKSVKRARLKKKRILSEKKQQRRKPILE